MKLEKLILKNFRSYSSIVEIPISNLTTLIGKNDIGKSTILEALEIYFNNDVVKIDLDDLSKSSTDDEIIISCVFSNLPNKIILDSCNETTFDKEYLLNDEKKLEIRKVYKMPMYVFALQEENSIVKAISGDFNGTKVTV